MARFFKVKIGDIWLTDTGDEDGRGCKALIPEVSELLAKSRGNTSVGNDGKGFRETPLVPDGAGRVFHINLAWLDADVYADIETLLDEAADTPGTVNVTGEGQPRNFDVDANVFDNDGPYISNDGFSGDNLKNVRISLITSQINEV